MTRSAATPGNVHSTYLAYVEGTTIEQLADRFGLSTLDARIWVGMGRRVEASIVRASIRTYHSDALGAVTIPED